MNFFRRRKRAKNFVLRKPSSIQIWNCAFQIPPTSCAYFPLLFLGHIITFPQDHTDSLLASAWLCEEREGESNRQNRYLQYNFFYVFLKRFLNGDSKEKIKQRNYFFMKRMKGFYFLLDLFNIYFYLEIYLF